MLKELVKYRVNLFPRYLRRFGGYRGLRIFLKLNVRPSSLLMRKKSETITINFYGKPLKVRAGTSDIFVFHQVFLDEMYAPGQSFLNPNLSRKLIIDGGANVGYTSIFFANAYPQARILAVEPEERNYAMLLENVKFYPNIVPIHAALWNKKGRLQITNPNGIECAFQVSERALTSENRSQSIEALTITDLLTETNSDSIEILKLDIEGSEIELFRSNTDWLGKTHMIVIELHDWLREGCSEALYKTIGKYSFQRIEHGEHTILFHTHARSDQGLT